MKSTTFMKRIKEYTGTKKSSPQKEESHYKKGLQLYQRFQGVAKHTPNARGEVYWAVAP